MSVQAALEESDMVLTVSPNYADEVCEDEGFACNMQEILQRKGVK